MLTVILMSEFNEHYRRKKLYTTNKKARERELRSVLLFLHQSPKYGLSIDKFDVSLEGIIHKNMIDFLLE